MRKSIIKPIFGLIILAALITAFTFFACDFFGDNDNRYQNGGDQRPQLNAPTGLSVDGERILRWDGMTNTQFFIIRVSGEEIFAVGNATSYDISSLLAESGDYTIAIQAIAAYASGYRNSPWAEIRVNIALPGLPKLNTPAGLRFENYIGTRLRWDAVSGANRYLVRVITAAATHTFDTTDLTVMLGAVPHGEFEVKVTAVGDGVNFNNSEYAVLAAIKLSAPTLRQLSATTLEIITGIDSDAVNYRLIIEWTGIAGSGSRTHDIDAELFNNGRATMQIISPADLDSTLIYTVTAVAWGDNVNFTTSNLSARIEL